MRPFRVLAPVLTLLLCLPLHAMTNTTEETDDKAPLSSGTFAGLKLRGIGPALMSGRIADIAVHPDDQSTWYVAVGSGNLWKTTNAGTTWEPIFDDQGSYSIGCVTIDPSRPDTIWVGSGENVSGRHVGYGDGVYRSRDGGRTWENLGLKNSEHIGTVLVHPEDSDTVYVAAQGPLWSSGGDRGLFRTTDGGQTWQKILSAGEYTGCNEVRMDPRDPDVLYAALHQKHRTVAAVVNGGPESGIFKSTDGGDTWRELTGGVPEGDKGKIGLAISHQDPDVVYATIELPHRKGGFFRSTDGGAHFEKRSDYVSGGTGPHYYQEIFACPHRFDRIYQMDVRLHVSDDGGRNFRPVGEKDKHGDNHAMAFNPDDPEYLLVGSDGGLYESWDLGQNWKFISNLPVTQFYKVAVDYDEPFYNLIGGTQDNATQYGPSRTDNTHGIRSSDWMITVFGDGHQPAIDPTNPDIIYSEWQVGNLVRHDRRTGEIVYLQPQPRDGEETDRFNWDSPIVISPHDPATLLFASQRVWKSPDRGDTWEPISGDLSRGLNRLTMPIMGRVQSIDATWDLYAMSKFGTITSLSQSPRNADLIYAGTDDGLVQVTEDGGANWRKIDKLPGVPAYFFVNDIKADLHDENTVYLCADNHKAGDFKPYVLKSADRGRTWESISGDLPERHLAWRIVQDHVRPHLLFLGTEFGVFFTIDGGGRWIKLTGGVPNIPFRDLAIQQRENDLVGATFGRGFYILDDYSALRGISEEMLDQPAQLFPVRDAWWYIPRRPLGFGRKASQGADFFVGPNPAFGATFTYYLKEPLRTRKQRRKADEKKLIKRGEDTPTPGWDALLEEKREEKPAILLVVRDADGNVVRYVDGPTGKGIQRVAWSLTRPSTAAWTQRAAAEDDYPDFPDRDPDDGILVAPGTYSVELHQRVDGVMTKLAGPQSFEVRPLREGGTLPGATPAAYTAFRGRLAELERGLNGARRVLRETRQRLTALRETLDRSTIADPQWGAAVRALERELADLQLRVRADEDRDVLNDPGPVSISERLSVAQMGTGYSLYGPTANHLASFEIAERDFGQVRAALNEIVTQRLPALEAQLDAAGLPWTPGRAVPGE